MLSIVKLATRNLFRHRRGSVLVGTGCALLALLLTVTFNLLQSGRERIRSTATTLMTGDFDVVGVYKYHPYRAVQLLRDPDRAEQAVRSLPLEVDTISRRINAVITLRTGHTILRHDQFAVGVDIDHEPILRRTLHLDQGSLDGLRQEGTAVISRQQAHELNIGLGDVVTLVTMSPKGTYNSVDLQVVGIATPLGSFSNMILIVPNPDLRKLLQFGPSAVSMLQVHLRHPLPDEQLVGVRSSVRKALQAAGFTTLPEDSRSWYDGKKDQLQTESWVGERMDVTGWRDEVRFQSDLIDALGAMAALLTALFLLIVSAGLVNTLWLSVRARTQEIGTLRAIGMRRWQVVAMLLVEGGCLGLASATVGALLGLAGCAVLNHLHLPVSADMQFFLGMGQHLTASTSPLIAGLVVLPLVAAAAVASLIPAAIAARLPPVLAINHVR